MARLPTLSFSPHFGQAGPVLCDALTTDLKTLTKDWKLKWYMCQGFRVTDFEDGTRLLCQDKILPVALRTDDPRALETIYTQIKDRTVYIPHLDATKPHCLANVSADLTPQTAFAPWLPGGICDKGDLVKALSYLVQIVTSALGGGEFSGTFNGRVLQPDGDITGPAITCARQDIMDVCTKALDNGFIPPALQVWQAYTAARENGVSKPYMIPSYLQGYEVDIKPSAHDQVRARAVLEKLNAFETHQV